MELDYFGIAARFYRYAALCRERALRTPFAEHRTMLDRQAKQWEVDARRVIEHAEIMISSRVLLGRLGLFDRPSTLE